MSIKEDKAKVGCFIEAVGQSGALDPQTQALLLQMAQDDAPPIETLTPIQARELMVALRELSGDAQPVANVYEQTIPGTEGEIPVRIYTPHSSEPFPVLVYFHGGGWVVCDLDTHDNVCRSLANAATCVVVSVDYRLAPEHKFPAAVEDAYTATQWTAKYANSIGGDANRIAVGGDSAGGNLATVVSLMARDRGDFSPVYQLLIYPVTNLSSFDTNSYRDYAEDYFLTKNMMEWFRNHYLKREEDCLNPYASPLLADDLSGLPPALVITAEFDPLRDEGEAYATRLKESGVSVRCIRYNGTIHGFLSMAGVLDKARDAYDKAATMLHSAFRE